MNSSKNNRDVQYQIVNGTAYHKETSAEVINVLEECRNNHTRIVVDYGDTVTKRSWGEVNDISGCVGRSTGHYQVPLLVHNNRSHGGGAMLDHCIIKISESRGKRVLYEMAEPKIELLLGNFTFLDIEIDGEYKVLVHEIYEKIMCSTEDAACKLGEEKLQEYESYLVPKVYKHPIIFDWTCTDPDNKQYGRQLDLNKFEFREKKHGIKEYNDEEIEMTINLDKYDEEKQRYYVSGYYKSLEDVKEQYGVQWRWIVAECIFEQESGLY